MKPKIALVDDDAHILTSVRIALEAHGFAVSIYTDGRQALAAFAKSPPDLAIFDVKMPRIHGHELLRAYRAFSTAPVIFLTSLDDEGDQKLGLRLGADDYITKPFSQAVLIERIRALLRRVAFEHERLDHNNSELNLNNANEPIMHGLISLRLQSNDLQIIDKNIKLTKNESLILSALLRQPKRVFARAELINILDKTGKNHHTDRSVDSVIKRLRQKIRQIAPDLTVIDTAYGAGYRLHTG